MLGNLASKLVRKPSAQHMREAICKLCQASQAETWQCACHYVSGAESLWHCTAPHGAHAGCMEVVARTSWRVLRKLIVLVKRPADGTQATGKLHDICRGLQARLFMQSCLGLRPTNPPPLRIQHRRGGVRLLDMARQAINNRLRREGMMSSESARLRMQDLLRVPCLGSTASVCIQNLKSSRRTCCSAGCACGQQRNSQSTSKSMRSGP